MKYLIGLQDIEWSKNRYWQKGKAMFEGDHHRKRKGYIGLWDRNLQKFIWFKIIKKCENQLAYVVERKSKVTSYWHNLERFD